MNFKNLLKYAKWVWVITVFAAGGYYLLTHWTRVAGYFTTTPISNLILSALFLAAGKLALTLLSKLAVEGEGLSLPYAEIFRIVALTQLGKYIPGGVWHFVGRFNMYHDREMSMKKSARALIIENVWLLTGAVMCGLASGMLSPQARLLLSRSGIHVPENTLPALGAGLIVIWFGVLVAFELLFRQKGKSPNLVALFKLMGVQILSWVLLGLSFAFVLPQMQAETLLLSVSVYALSWIAGYVAIFAPGGIGIREATLTWMLASVISSQDALMYSTVHRFLYIAVEVALGVVAGIMGAVAARRKKPPL